MASEQAEGGPITGNPRLVCEDCEEMVWVTWPRRAKQGFFHFECSCRAITNGDDHPDSWSRYGEVAIPSENDQGADRYTCPEGHCVASFPSGEGLLSHMEWDHQRSELEARRMMMDV